MFILGGLFFFQLLTAITEAMVAADTIGEAKSSIFCSISSGIRQVRQVFYLGIRLLQYTPTYLSLLSHICNATLF
jgi:hypothetical protein